MVKKWQTNKRTWHFSFVEHLYDKYINFTKHIHICLASYALYFTHSYDS